MTTSPTPAPGIWSSLVLVILIWSAVLVPIIYLEYGYDPASFAGSAAGVVILLGAAALLVLLRRRARRSDRAATMHRATAFGVALGALWMVEIAVNNFAVPPLPERDVIDDVFWALIAIGIFGYASLSTYRTNRIRSGIETGAWSGFVSGAVACGAGLSLIVFAMGLLVRDPLNVAEWAARGAASGAPTMAAYFAYQTFAGALLHLTVLGLAMGLVLGLFGGLLGRGIRAARRSTLPS